MNHSVKPQSPRIIPSLSGEDVEPERPCLPDGSTARTPAPRVGSRARVPLALPGPAPPPHPVQGFTEDHASAQGSRWQQRSPGGKVLGCGAGGGGPRN